MCVYRFLCFKKKIHPSDLIYELDCTMYNGKYNKSQQFWMKSR